MNNIPGLIFILPGAAVKNGCRLPIPFIISLNTPDGTGFFLRIIIFPG